MRSMSLFHKVFRPLNKTKPLSVPEMYLYLTTVLVINYTFVNSGIKFLKSGTEEGKNTHTHIYISLTHLFNLVGIFLKTDLRTHACLSLSCKSLCGASFMEEVFVVCTTLLSTWKGLFLRVLNTVGVSYSGY